MNRSIEQFFILIFSMLVAAMLFAQQPESPSSPDAAAVPALQQKIEAAVVAGDGAFAETVLSRDFHFRHGDGWTRGEKSGGIEDDRAAFMKRIADKEYLVHDLDQPKIEMHGDVAITYGRYTASLRGSKPERAWFAVWFERIYQKRNGRRMFLSQRTVHGASYGPTRESVSEK